MKIRLMGSRLNTDNIESLSSDSQRMLNYWFGVNW